MPLFAFQRFARRQCAPRAVLALPVLAVLAACADRTPPTGPGPTPGQGLALAFASPRDTVFLGEAVRFTAAATAGSLTGVTLRWSVADTSVATVGTDGTVTGRAAGTTILTVTGAAATATRSVTVTTAPLLASGVVWAARAGGLLTIDSGAVPVLVAVRDAIGRDLPASRITLALEDTAGVFALDTVTRTVRVARNGWARGAVVARDAATGAVLSRQPLKSTGWLARVIFGNSVPQTVREQFSAAWAMWAERIQDTLPTRTRTWDPRFRSGAGFDGVTAQTLADSGVNTNRVVVLVEYVSFRGTGLSAVGGNLGEVGAVGATFPSVSATMQLNADLPGLWTVGQTARETMAHELGHALGIGSFGFNQMGGRTPFLAEVTAPGQTTPTGRQFLGPRTTALLRTLGVTPAWWQGVPMRTTTSHWAVGGPSELMHERSNPGAVISALSFTALVDLGYRVDLRDAPMPAFVFEAPWQ